MTTPPGGPPLGRVDQARAVRLYAEAMHDELNLNTHKGDWAEEAADALVEDCAYHVAKLVVAERLAHAEGIHEYSADIGNLAMMVADLSGVLGQPPATSATLIHDVVGVPSAVDSRGKHDKEVESDSSVLAHDLHDAAARFIADIDAVLLSFKLGAPTS